MSQKSYKYRFYPTSEQAKILERTFGCVRFVYNHMLRYRTDEWHAGNRINYNTTSALLTKLKKQEETAWLGEVSSVPLQQSLRHLQTAFVNFFEKRSKYPTFKKKRDKQSATYARNSFKWCPDTHTLEVAKLGKLKIKWSRFFQSDPSSVTLSKDPSGRYFVSFKIEEPNKIMPEAMKEIGIDLGIAPLATTSDGHKFGNPKNATKNEKRLRLLQQRLSRRKKGGKRKEKARLQVAKLHAKIQDTRIDYIHKMTTQLIHDNQVIVIEDLSPRNMMQNRHLAKAIGDCAWSEITRQLEYKADWYGRKIIKIDRFFLSSKRCHVCGHILEFLPLDARKWICPECKTEHDRDINAAKNILAVGHTVSAQGHGIRPKRSDLRSVGDRGMLRQLLA